MGIAPGEGVQADEGGDRQLHAFGICQPQQEILHQDGRERLPARRSDIPKRIPTGGQQDVRAQYCLLHQKSQQRSEKRFDNRQQLIFNC